MSYEELYLELFNALIELDSISEKYKHPVQSTVDYKTLIHNFPNLKVDFKKIKIGDIVEI